MKKLSDKLFVSPQINLEDIPKIKEAGIQTVLCNRPDGEESDQVEHEKVERNCKIHDLDFVYQPVQSSAIDERDVDQFDQNIERAKSPVLSYCRTGTRCTILWALSQRGKMDDDRIIALAENAGYDLRKIFDDDQS